MAPAGRQSNGRSPLVNKQCQITSFFSKSTPSPLSKENPKSPSLSPNPNPSNNNLPSSPSNSPATPSPLHPKQKKTPLIIPSKPITSSTPSYGQEVVDRRIRVYWPLDDAWYEGFVALYDGSSNKHLVRYDDGEEELVDLGKEKIEWVEESVAVKKKKFKRLRRGGDEAVVDEKAVEKCNVDMFDDDEDDGVGDNASVDDDDDSEDEDWGKNLEKEMEEVADDDMDVELADEEEEEEEEEEEDEKVRSKEKCGKKSASRKRKVIGIEGVSSKKKSKSGADGKNGIKVSQPESSAIPESK